MIKGMARLKLDNVKKLVLVDPNPFSLSINSEY